MKLNIATAVIIGGILAGCSSIKVKYDGEELPGDRDGKIAVYEALPPGYSVIGKATATGRENVDRSKLIESLTEKAAAVGATGIVITDYQVIPDSGEQTSSIWDMSDWGGKTTTGLVTMERDFDGAYGTADMTAFGLEKPQGTSISRRSYIRILYADFIALR